MKKTISLLSLSTVCFFFACMTDSNRKEDNTNQSSSAEQKNENQSSSSQLDDLNNLSSSTNNSSSESSSSSEAESNINLSKIEWQDNSAEFIELDLKLRDFSFGHPDFERHGADNIEACQPNAYQTVTQEHIDWAQKAYGVNSIATLGDSLSFGGSIYGEYRDYVDLFSDTKRWFWRDQVNLAQGIFADSIKLTQNLFEAQPSLGNHTCFSKEASIWFTDKAGKNYSKNQHLALEKYTLHNGETVWGHKQYLYLPFEQDPNFGFGNQNLKIWNSPELNSAHSDFFYNEMNLSTGVSDFPAATNFSGNYNFTSVISTFFKYTKGDYLYLMNEEFWIYIDGKLIFDGGGYHGPAEAIIQFEQLAKENPKLWEDESIHTIQIFLAERQGDGSYLQLYTNIDKFSKPQLTSQGPALVSGSKFGPHLESLGQGLNAIEIDSLVFNLDRGDSYACRKGFCTSDNDWDYLTFFGQDFRFYLRGGESRNLPQSIRIDGLNQIDFIDTLFTLALSDGDSEEIVEYQCTIEPLNQSANCITQVNKEFIWYQLTINTASLTDEGGIWSIDFNDTKFTFIDLLMSYSY